MDGPSTEYYSVIRYHSTCHLAGTGTASDKGCTTHHLRTCREASMCQTRGVRECLFPRKCCLVSLGQVLWDLFPPASMSDLISTTCCIPGSFFCSRQFEIYLQHTWLGTHGNSDNILNKVSCKLLGVPTCLLPSNDAPPETGTDWAGASSRWPLGQKKLRAVRIFPPLAVWVAASVQLHAH